MKTLCEIMMRHDEWNDWWSRMPLSSRSLYAGQAEIHHDRGELIRMLTMTQKLSYDRIDRDGIELKRDYSIESIVT